MNILLPYILINSLFKSNFWLYQKLYFKYKETFEGKEIKFINSNIKSGMNVVDIGANIGFYTLLFSKLVGSEGCVYSFEPDKQNYHYLKKLCNKYNNIKLKNMAVGNKVGKIPLYLSDKLNVDHLTYDNGEKREVTQVSCVTIDKYFKDKKIDFIKIDTQGYEYQVLLGMKETLNKSRNIIILSEYSPFDLSSAGTKPENYLSLLKKMGFKLEFLKPLDKLKKSNRLSYTNIIASKSS
jgi:FkbM family methyltransferase